jgi:hypothetical protein
VIIQCKYRPKVAKISPKMRPFTSRNEVYFVKLIRWLRAAHAMFLSLCTTRSPIKFTLIRMMNDFRWRKCRGSYSKTSEKEDFWTRTRNSRKLTLPLLSRILIQSKSRFRSKSPPITQRISPWKRVALPIWRQTAWRARYRWVSNR